MPVVTIEGTDERGNPIKITGVALKSDLPQGHNSTDGGWIKYGKIIDNWGFVLATREGTEVEFQQPYKEFPPFVVASASDDIPIAITITNVSTAGFKIWGDSMVWWRAIGS
jgi:hypothetical protein